MSKPDDIPEDVWESADATLMGGPLTHIPTDLWDKQQTIIARAILSERTKAAEIASNFPWSIAIENFDDARDVISRAIRKGGKE